MSIPWRPGQLLIAETERFILRSLTPDDATPTYISWWNDAEIQKGLNFPPRGWDRQRAIQHIARFDNVKAFHLGIFCKDSDKMIGFFAAFPDQATKVAKTNIVIGDKDYWGKQVVQEVRGRMLFFLFEVMGMEKVKGEIHGRNLPSIFNYKQQGFTSEGILRSEMSGVDGGRVDIYVFGLLKEEWEAQKQAVKSDEQ